MTETELAQNIQAAIYKAVRAAVVDELLIYHQSTVIPMMNLQIEMSETLRQIVAGQALVESALADLNAGRDGDEPWRRSLEGDD